MAQFKVQSKALQEALRKQMKDTIAVPEYTQTIVHHAKDTIDGLQLEVEVRNLRLDVLDPNRVYFKRIIL